MLIESEDPGFWPALIDWLNKYPAIPNTTTVIRLLSDSKASQIKIEHWTARQKMEIYKNRTLDCETKDGNI
jgi:hypothetical protein